MPTTAPKSEKRFTLAPEGTHVARCVTFIHIGTNMDEYKGEPREFNKIRLTFELPNETKVFKEGEAAKPLVTSQEYTLSMAPKANLRKLVEGIIGTALQDAEAEAFDVESLVGMTCLIAIKHKTSGAGNTRAEIATAMPLLKGSVAPAQVNPSKILSYSNWSEELFEAQPDFIKDKIKTSNEYKAMKAGKRTAAVANGEYPAEEINPEDIPF